MPEYGMGYWQCKLRYRNQEELLSVAREHKRRGLPMDAIVVDFFHWTMQGEFKFEPRDWPEPEYGSYDFDNYRYYAGPAMHQHISCLLCQRFL